MSARYATPQAAYDAWAAIYDAGAEQDARLRHAPKQEDRWATMVDFFRPRESESPDVAATAKHLRPSDTLLDVGAGAGLRTLPLASRVAEVRALDPSPAMVAGLREEAAALSNLEVLDAMPWPPPEPLGASDVVFSAQVVYYVREIDAFLDAYEAHARRLCIVTIAERSGGSPPTDVFAAVHGEPYAEQPASEELIQVLEARGITPSVERIGLSDWSRPSVPYAAIRRNCLVTEGTAQDAILKRELLARFGPDMLSDYRAFHEFAVIAWEPPR